MRPILKRKNPTLTFDYRPIGILSAMSKVFEKIIDVQMSEFIEENDFIDVIQS